MAKRGSKTSTSGVSGVRRIRGWSSMSPKARAAFARNARRVKYAAKECGIKRGMTRRALKEAMKYCVRPMFRKGPKGGAAQYIDGY